MTEPVATGETDDHEVGTPENMQEERKPSPAEQPKVVNRKEKRKALKKDKRKQIRKELAEKARAEEEARLNDPEEQRKIQLEEEMEKQRLERERMEFEERERIFLEELEKKRKEEEEEELRNAVERESKLKQEGAEEGLDEDDEWEYIEEGPPEIIWQGNEIIVKKNKVKVKKKDVKQDIEKEDANRPTSNPLPPQSEAYAAYKNTPMTSVDLLDTVAQQVPNFGTEQDKAHCPFHIKTGACRFGLRCNRVHYYPDKSTTLLIKNMYNGPGLSFEQDEGLEHTEEEVDRSYEEFYEDVHTEFLKFGEIINFKVCRNGSFHLRGNVYVQYKSLDSAVMAYNSVQGRYFAGKQVKCEYVSLARWKVAICGEFMKSRLKTCSRGSACNFLHCFSNPGGDYEWADSDKPPPRFWVKKMIALFGNSDDTWHDKHIEQISPRDPQHSSRIFSSDRDRDSYYNKRRSSSRSHHDESHVRKKRHHEREKDKKNNEDEEKYKKNRCHYNNLKDTDSDGEEKDKNAHRKQRDHSETRDTRNERESKSRDYYYNNRSRRKTHSSSSDEDSYVENQNNYTNKRSRHRKKVSSSSNDDEESDYAKREHKSDYRRSGRHDHEKGVDEVAHRESENELFVKKKRRDDRKHGTEKSIERGRSRDSGCFSDKHDDMNDRWDPDNSLNDFEVFDDEKVRKRKSSEKSSSSVEEEMKSVGDSKSSQSNVKRKRI